MLTLKSGQKVSLMSDEVCSEIGLTQNWTNSKIGLPHKSGQKVSIMSDRVCSEIRLTHQLD